MGLLDLIREDESLDYISLEEAINLLAEKSESNVWQVATYLLNKNIHIQLNSHQRDIGYKIIETSSNSHGMGAGWVGENDAFAWLQYIAENEMESYSSRTVTKFSKYYQGCVTTFWNRKKFFNNKDIKLALGNREQEHLPNKSNTELHKSLIPIWDTSYLELQLNDVPDLIEIDPDIYLIESINFEDQPTCQEVKKHPLFFKNKTFSIHEAACLMSDYSPMDTVWDYEKIEWLENNPKYAEASNFIFSAVRTDLFQEFSNGEYFITSGNLKKLLTESGHFIDGFNDKDFANLSNENLAENTQLKNTIASLELEVAIGQVTVKELNAEIAKLKTELLDKEQKIKEFESLHKQNDTDLMSLIFDESATDRYAPDLVLSIKLWEHTYITNPKNDSHSNKAGTWLGKNTGYDTAKKHGSASKIRDITAPFINWSTLRDKNYKN